MFSIDCPWCGKRDRDEFHCDGEDRGARPLLPETLGDAEWAAYVFLRENRKGVIGELWQHRHGCRRWFRVRRDTATDAILAVSPVETPKPSRVAEKDEAIEATSEQGG